MIFEPLELSGNFLVQPERFSDERGFFARTYCREEFEQHGIDPVIAQCSVSYNPTPHTLRGMHLQAEPHAETKLVRCTLGSIFDVLVDLRPASTTFRKWVGVALSAENHHMLVIAPGIAHGFLTLEADSEVFYQISNDHHPASARGVRWNDPAFGIQWPAEPQRISERDANYPDLG